MGQTAEFAAGSWIVRQPPSYAPSPHPLDSFSRTSASYNSKRVAKEVLLPPVVYLPLFTIERSVFTKLLIIKSDDLARVAIVARPDGGL